MRYERNRPPSASRFVLLSLLAFVLLSGLTPGGDSSGSNPPERPAFGYLSLKKGFATFGQPLLEGTLEPGVAAGYVRERQASRGLRHFLKPSELDDGAQKAEADHDGVDRLAVEEGVVPPDAVADRSFAAQPGAAVQREAAAAADLGPVVEVEEVEPEQAVGIGGERCDGAPRPRVSGLHSAGSPDPERRRPAGEIRGGVEVREDLLGGAERGESRAAEGNHR